MFIADCMLESLPFNNDLCGWIQKIQITFLLNNFVALSAGSFGLRCL